MEKCAKCWEVDAESDVRDYKRNFREIQTYCKWIEIISEDLLTVAFQMLHSLQCSVTYI